jgi:hypothetical protein
MRGGGNVRDPARGLRAHEACGATLTLRGNVAARTSRQPIADERGAAARERMVERPWITKRR